MKKISHLWNQSGQMLLFVLVVVLLLFIVLFAIITNVRVDIKETQMEREYEKGYSMAEEQIFEIGVEGYDNWVASGHTCYPRSDFIALPDHADFVNFCEAEFDECCLLENLGTDGKGKAVVKKKSVQGVMDATIQKDDVLELNLGGAGAGVVEDTFSWEGANALSIMLVCKETATGKYSNFRMAVCRADFGADETCGMTDTEGFKMIGEAQGIGGPLDFATCGAGKTAELLRFRAIGADAFNVDIEDTDLPSQSETVRVQGLASGSIRGGDKPVPEVETSLLLNRFLPSLFDYVLFVADGDVAK